MTWLDLGCERSTSYGDYPGSPDYLYDHLFNTVFLATNVQVFQFSSARLLQALFPSFAESLDNVLEGALLEDMRL